MNASNKKYMVINQETEISHCAFATKAEAEKEAKEMTEYHGETFIVVERK